MDKIFDVCPACGGTMYRRGVQVVCADCGLVRPVTAWQCPHGCGCFTDGAVCESCEELGYCDQAADSAQSA